MSAQRAAWSCRRLVVLSALVGLVALPATPAQAAASAAMASDFNGDQVWNQATPGVKGRVESSFQAFGRALASGDFDRDGYADLAVGVPYDRSGPSGPRGGVVNVLYGSRRGLTANGDQRWSQANLPGSPSRDDEFGGALAADDFDGDGYVDLAVGSRGESVDGVTNRGAVQLIYGGSGGLSAARTMTLTRAMTGASYSPFAAHWFGSSLAAGDLNDDGIADLAVGAPGAGDFPGDVGVFYGASGGLTAAGSQLWSQESPGIEDDLDINDRFGDSLAIGDFDGDAIGDLAIAVSETFGSALGGGRVNVLFGSPGGLTAAGAQDWSRESPGVPGSILASTGFGGSLAAGDFDGDGADELAVGAGSPDESGEVIVLIGSGSGLTSTGVQLWTQNSPGVPGHREDEDKFGSALASANYGRSDRDDLAIGVVGENNYRGMVEVLYGRSSGLSATNAQSWTQNTPGVKGSAGAFDFFAVSLTP